VERCAARRDSGHMTLCATISADADATLQMLDDEFAFGVVSETVVLEDGTVVELCQSVDADLTCLHIEPFTV